MILSNFVFYSGYDFRYCLKKQNKTKKTYLRKFNLLCVFVLFGYVKHFETIFR